MEYNIATISTKKNLKCIETFHQAFGFVKNNLKYSQRV